MTTLKPGPPKRKQWRRIGLSLSLEAIRKLDAIAESFGVSRTEIIERLAAREYLDGNLLDIPKSALD